MKFKDFIKETEEYQVPQSAQEPVVSSGTTFQLQAERVGTLIVALFNSRTVTHILHLNTENYEEHKALNDFYDAIVDLTDRFAESSVTYFGKPVWPNDLSIGLMKPECSSLYLRNLLSEITNLSSMFQQEDLKNILAEITELCSSTIYKLEHLK